MFEKSLWYFVNTASFCETLDLKASRINLLKVTISPMTLKMKMHSAAICSVLGFECARLRDDIQVGPRSYHSAAIQKSNSRIQSTPVHLFLD